VPLLLLAFWLVFASGLLSAQNTVWQPSPGHTQIPIWPGSAPDPQAVAGPERATVTKGKELVAGRPWAYITNVSRPTMTLYPQPAAVPFPCCTIAVWRTGASTSA
jgi:hypothetical protein